MSQELIKHILIVDDQRSTARALRDRLTAVDPSFSVIDIPSGEEALLEIQQRDFDLVISDSRLSGMSGAEFMASALRRKDDLPFFVISSYSLDEVRAAFAGQEVLAFFEKPVDMPTLIDAVSELLLGEVAPALVPVDVSAIEPASQPEADRSAPIASLLADIQAELGASAIALADGEGQVLARQAAPDAPERFDDLVYRLAGRPDEAAALSAMLGDTPLGSVAYYAGSAVNLFRLSVNQGEARHLLVAAVRPKASQPPGEIVDYLYQIRVSLIALLSLPEGTTQTQPSAEAPFEDEPQAEMEEVVDQPTASESENPPDREIKYVPPFIDLDLENVDSQLDTGALDSFWEEEASRDTLNGDVLSMDEAIELGLIPEELTDDEDE